MAKKTNPKLDITYSFIYDQMIHFWGKKKYTKTNYELGKKYTKRIQTQWKKIERKAFNTISKASGLKWKKPVIDCYITTAKIYSFSGPLTIAIKKDMKLQIEILIHELVHNIVVQNMKKVRGKLMHKKYGRYGMKTKIHVLINAILKQTLLQLISKQRVSKHIKRYNKQPAYKLAWQIVEKQGADNIIKELVKS